MDEKDLKEYQEYYTELTDEKLTEFSLLIYVGSKLEIYFNPKNFNNNKIEIRSIVDNEYVAYKFKLRKYEDAYDYKMEHISLLITFYLSGYLRSVK